MSNNIDKVRIFIVDDEKSVRDSLTKWFEEFNYVVGSASNAKEALEKFKPDTWDIVFLDIRMPGMDGTDLHHKLKEMDPEICTVMVTAYASVETAVKTLKDGAYDYITKPIDPDYLIHLISKIIEQKKLRNENLQLKNRIHELNNAEKFIGESPAIKKVINLVHTVAKTDTSVMIRGESGTGKELLAQMIHATSSRCFFPIITVNCGGLTPGLAESEFFGHEKGAFTGAMYLRKGKLEMAHQGTIFLDEIGCIDAKTQMDLLRVIETKEFTRVGGNKTINVDFRIICATNLDMEKAVEDGTFRKDLYYRLNVFTINVPPLRERRSDIPLIANGLISKISSQLDKHITGISNEAMQMLINREWSGNVRELRNCIERAIVVATKPILEPEFFIFEDSNVVAPESQSLMALEKNYIQEILNRVEGNITHASEILQIDRTTLYHKIKKYGLCR